jgi:hypothetical protein
LHQIEILALDKISKNGYLFVAGGKEVLKLIENERLLISDWGVLLRDDFYELLEVYPSVLVFVSVFNHLLDLSRGKSLPHTFTHLRELLHSERAHSLLVENIEKLSQTRLILVVTIKAEDPQETFEVHLDVIRLGMHDLQNFACFFLQAQGFDGGGEFFS